MIILDKDSEAARERARREEPEKFHSSEYDLTKIFNELQPNEESGYESTEVFHELKASESSVKWLKKQYPEKIKVRKSSVYPVCYLAVVNDTMFVEPYNCARRGGGAPVFEIKRDRGDDTKNNLYNTYMRHFVSLWIKPCQGEKRENMDELCEVMKDFTLKDMPRYFGCELGSRIESCEEDIIVREQIPT